MRQHVDSSGQPALERPDPSPRALRRLEAVALPAEESTAMFDGIAGEIR